MKKVVLVIAALCFGMAASAQILVGGNLGYGNTHTNGSINDAKWDGNSTNHFEIAPKIGYQLNDKMSFGLTFGYAFDNSVSVSSDPDDLDIDIDDNLLDFYSKSKINSSAWQLAPYFRYAVANFGKCSFFVEASVPFAWNMPKKTHTEWEYTILGKTYEGNEDVTSNTRAFSWGIAITPGFSYEMGEHCSMDLYIDVFSLAYHQKIVTTEVGSNESVVYNNDFYIGFNSLPEHQLFRLGFNYTF